MATTIDKAKLPLEVPVTAPSTEEVANINLFEIPELAPNLPEKGPGPTAEAQEAMARMVGVRVISMILITL